MPECDIHVQVHFHVLIMPVNPSAILFQPYACVVSGSTCSRMNIITCLLAIVITNQLLNISIVSATLWTHSKNVLGIIFCEKMLPGRG